jgi:hypothetical protein
MFFHFHGQRGVRLDRAQTVHSSNLHQDPGYLFSLISVLLFFMPDVYIRKLEEMSVDGLVNEIPWNQFRNDLRRDWETSITPVCTEVVLCLRAVNLA